MSVPVVGSSSVIAAAFRQAQAADTRNGSSPKPGRAGGGAAAEGTATDGSSAAIKALKQQLAEAQEALQRLVDAGASEQAVRSAQQRVQACASALAAAVTQQAEAARKAALAGAAGEQYI